MEAILEALWQNIHTRTWLEVAVVTAIFAGYSIIFIWVVACILARIPWPVKEDAELKVHLGVLITLTIYLVGVQIFLVLLATHRGNNAVFLDYCVLFFGMVMTIFSFILALGLGKQIRNKLERIRNRRPAA